MFNPLNVHIDALKADIKRLQDNEAHVEALKIDVKRLQDNENDSFESVASDSPEKERKKKSSGDVSGATMEALSELQIKVDELGEELRKEFKIRMAEGDKKFETWMSLTSEKYKGTR